MIITSRHSHGQGREGEGDDSDSRSSLSSDTYYSALASEDDVSSCCSLQSARSDTRLRLCSMNAWSVKNKLSAFHGLLLTHDIDIALIQETHLNDSVSDEDLLPPGYSVLRRDRKDRKGGGVLIALRDDIPVTRIELEPGGVEEVEFVLIKLNLPLFPVFICNVYRPNTGCSQVRKDYDLQLQRLMDKLGTILGRSPDAELLIIGDFNFHVDWDIKPIVVRDPTRVRTLIDHILLLCPHQLIRGKTRAVACDNTNDLIFATNVDLVSDIQKCVGLSEHLMIRFSLMTDYVKPVVPPREIYLYSKANYDGLNSFFMRDVWGPVLTEDVDEGWEHFLEIYRQGIARFVPKVEAKPHFNNSKPWIDGEVKRLIRKRDRMFQRLLKLGSVATNLSARYDRCRKDVKNLINFKKRNFFFALADDSSGSGQKKFFRFVGRNVKSKLPTCFDFQGSLVSDKPAIAEAFNTSFQTNFSTEFFPRSYRFFTNVPRVQTGLSSLHFSIPDYLSVLSSFGSHTSSGPDGIDIRVLQNCPSLARPLVDLFNSCLLRGVLPLDWRRANIVPVYKKGRRDLVENYRPISLTSVVMRCFEKLVKKPLVAFLASLDIPGESQHGFRASRSCCSNLLALQSTIFEWMESRTCNSVDAIFLDWSKAFDKVIHNILLAKLEHYGIRDSLLVFFRNFLSSREQSVTYCRESSSWQPVTSGVPQGTVLAPILFNVYVHDISSLVTSSFLQYADDSVIFGQVDQSNRCPTLTMDLLLLSDWCARNGMLINGNKSQCVRFSLASPRLEQPHYAFDGVSIPVVREHKHLGVILSSDLKATRHVEYAIQKARGALFSIHRNFSRCTVAVRKKLLITIVYPILLFGIPSWLPTLQTDCDLLSSFHKLCTKVVLGFPRPYISSDARLASLDLLPIVKQIDVITLRYFRSNHIGTELFPLRLHRGALIIHKLPPLRSILYKRSYFFRVVKLWNALPDEVKRSSMSSFPDILSTYYKFV